MLWRCGSSLSKSKSGIKHAYRMFNAILSSGVELASQTRSGRDHVVCRRQECTDLPRLCGWVSLQQLRGCSHHMRR